ncbi:MAG: radical SAM protein, partial [Desulfuromonas sp.]
VAFYGGSFTLLPLAQQRAYLEVVTPFLQQGRLDGIRLSTRPDALSPETVARLAEYGVSTVEIGVQSFSPEILRFSERGHGVEDLPEVVESLRRAKIRVGLQLMPGLPGADRRESRRSLGSALALAPDFLRLYPVLVLGGTALAALWRQGEYRSLCLMTAVSWCAELLWRCREAQVPVIRIGLQESEGLHRPGALLAGPWHPAFGQLVRSRLWFRALWRLMHEGAGEVRIHPADWSDAIGHRQQNLHWFSRLGGGLTLKQDASLMRESLACAKEIYPLQRLAAYSVA